MTLEHLLKLTIGALLLGLVIAALWVVAPFLLFFGGLVGVFAAFAFFVNWGANRYRASKER